MSTDTSSTDTSLRTALPRLTPRQYAGVAVVALAYLGGVAGWTYAATQVEAEPPEGVHERLPEHPHDSSSGAAVPTDAMMDGLARVELDLRIVGDVPTSAVRV